jgi:hypothetical protein
MLKKWAEAWTRLMWLKTEADDEMFVNKVMMIS